jgi:hypothetical protein
MKSSGESDARFGIGFPHDALLDVERVPNVEESGYGSGGVECILSVAVRVNDALQRGAPVLAVLIGDRAGGIAEHRRLPTVVSVLTLTRRVAQGLH